MGYLELRENKEFYKGVVHFHSSFSSDSSFKPQQIIDCCLKNGIDFIALTDHNTMQGYFYLKELIEKENLPIFLIPGEEIASREGEVIGLFLKEEIPKGLSLEQTIAEVKKQDALLYLPHPFDSLRRERIRDKSLIEKFEKDFEIIEIFNSRNLKSSDNKKAREFCEKHNKVACYAPDAHFQYEFLNSVISVPAFKMQASDFLEKLALAKALSTKKALRGFLNSLIKKYLIFR